MVRLRRREWLIHVAQRFGLKDRGGGLGRRWGHGGAGGAERSGDHLPQGDGGACGMALEDVFRLTSQAFGPLWNSQKKSGQGTVYGTL